MSISKHNLKRWLITFFLFVVSFISLSVFVNYIVDPFQQYAKFNFFSPYYPASIARYLNSGLIKNYDFDTVVLGSSMIQNFLLDDVQKAIRGKPIKLCMSAGSGYEFNLLLNLLFEKKKNLKTILYCLDMESFLGDPKRMFQKDFPLYLYDIDDNIWFRYLFNLDTLKHSFEMIYKNIFVKEDPFLQYNSMYIWSHLHQHDFGRKKVLKIWEKDFNKQSPPFLNPWQSFEFNILGYIKNNPKIEFIVFFPPYSILLHKKRMLSGDFENWLSFKEKLFTTLLSFENVKIFDFQIAREITFNLDNYRDLGHYSEDINKLMLEWISSDKYRVKEENKEFYLEELKKQAENFDVDNQSVICHLFLDFYVFDYHFF